MNQIKVVSYQLVLASGASYSEHILHVTGEKRVIIPSLTASDMKTVSTCAV